MVLGRRESQKQRAIWREQRERGTQPERQRWQEYLAQLEAELDEYDGEA